jgi:hypothetical protein
MGIGIVVVFFAGVTLAVGWVGSGGPDVPHSVDGERATCVTCHPTDGLADSHHDRVEDSCRSCHSQGSSEASVPVVGEERVASADGGSSGSVAIVATSTPGTLPATRRWPRALHPLYGSERAARAHSTRIVVNR